MKFFVLLALALLGVAAGAQLPDSATQGPNPQDIATPEPEYIDIEDPAPVAAAPAPRPVIAAPAPRPVVAPVARPVIAAAPAPVYRQVARPVAVAQSFVQQPIQQQIVQRAQYLSPVAQQVVQPQLVGHTYSSKSGYQYRRPVYNERESTNMNKNITLSKA
ncbi:cyclin-dependent kinase inhibitor 1C isoform X1 [Drosophila bipectinata]|uniref:cyclin-dependent kinase inhibitor 1C isoform X1 n=1 Tax=Drosophila bipectinata TaxID=42026 RepID=UPI001C88FC03|nr:arabinogalactan protein 1 isoform X1 [Drosophila bipectinata]